MELSPFHLPADMRKSQLPSKFSSFRGCGSYSFLLLPPHSPMTDVRSKSRKNWERLIYWGQVHRRGTQLVCYTSPTQGQSAQHRCNLYQPICYRTRAFTGRMVSLNHTASAHNRPYATASHILPLWKRRKKKSTPSSASWSRNHLFSVSPKWHVRQAVNKEGPIILENHLTRPELVVKGSNITMKLSP